MKQTHLIAQELLKFLPRVRENAMPISSVLHHLHIGTHDFKERDVRSMLDRFSRHEGSDLMKCSSSRSFYLDLMGRNEGYNENPIIPRPRNLKRAPEKLSDMPERSKNMLSLYNSGKSLEEIGDKYDLTRERVRQLLLPAESLGLLDKKRKRVPEELTVVRQKLRRLKTAPSPNISKNYERNAEIEKLVKEGFTYSQVARKVGVSRSTVCAVMYRLRQRKITFKRNSDIVKAHH